MRDKIKEIIVQNVDESHKGYEKAIDEILLLFNVSGQSEQLKCQCKRARFTRTVDADFNPLCGRCGKAL